MNIAIAFLTILLTTSTFNSSAQNNSTSKPNVVYKTDNLVVVQISAHAYEHISYKQTQDYGNVPCNGVIVKSGNETIVFDTPTNNKSAIELINWIKKNLDSQVNAVVVTHFHDDSLGGLTAFHDSNIPSYAYTKTIELAKESNEEIPENSFSESLTLQVGGENISARFFGEGHTKDNVVAYFPKDNILFGGCLLKELNAGKGYLGDSNVDAWSATVERVKKAYPNVKIVVPGHGEVGDSVLLDYTIKLFK